MTVDAASLRDFGVFHPKFEPECGLLTLCFDHGKANEMGRGELDAFDALCRFVEGTPEVRTLCSTSHRVSRSGKPIFIAGANVTERNDWTDDEVRSHVRRQRALMQRIRELPIVHVVLATGVTLGWGVEYLLTGDYVLATSAASFALPETGLGILPGARGTAELAALVGPAQALRLGCTGETISAREAHSMGLCQEVFDEPEQAQARVGAFAASIALRSPTAVGLFKRALLEGLGRPTQERLEIEARAYDRLVELGEASIGRAHFAEVRAGRRPPWRGRDV